MALNDESSSKPEFKFRNVNLSLKDNHILRNVSGIVQRGEILAVLGPKGSGKTALVSTLGGVLKPYIGDILVNGQSMRQCDGEIAFVQSTDLFLPTLTVYETLMFSARLRLQDDGSNLNLRVRQVIDLLHLDLFLDFMIQIATPSIKKRLSIACEMLTDHTVLIIDEPITDLDYKDGLDLMRFLRYYMNQYGKIGIISLRACPSGIYGTCTKSLMLYGGHTAFYGTSDQCERFLHQLGTSAPKGYHPIDYMLELLNEDCFDDTVPVQDKIIQAAYKMRTSPEWPDYYHLSKYHVTSPSLKRSQSSTSKFENTNNNVASKSRIKYDADEVKVLINHSKDTKQDYLSFVEGFPTSYCNQFWILLCRNFTNARRRILFPISVIQNIYILVICVLVWWQPPRTEETVKDRLGLFFFTVVQWAFFALLDGILTFPKEIKVINRERKYSLYRLSAFCLSKTISEIPLAVLQPCIYLAVIYWVANLNGVIAFIASLGVLMLDVLAAQSIGMFIGAALHPPWTVTMVPLGLLSMMLWGGAFNTPPAWFRWGRFASYFFYGLNAFIHLEFKDAAPIKCATKSMIPVCNMIDPTTNSTYTEFNSDIVLMMTNVDWPFLHYLAVLAGIFVVTKVLWYVAMRIRKLDE